jgi:hypothetical protein
MRIVDALAETRSQLAETQSQLRNTAAAAAATLQETQPRFTLSASQNFQARRLR